MKAPRARARRLGPPLGIVATLALSGNAFGQDRPSEDEMFGAPVPSEPPGAEAAEPPRQSAPAEPMPGASPAPAPASRDEQILGGSAGVMFEEPPAPADPLTIGGQLYLRLQSTAVEGQAPGNWSLGAPSLLDVYLDARPNDRVRAFVLGRMAYDSTVATNPNEATQLGPVQATGGTAGSQSLDALFQPQSGGPRVSLDQLWLRFDIDHTVFVTAGKQHVRWGTGRFWAPTDYLHLRRRNPLDVFDARSGTSLLKLHVPVESKAWNFYGYAITEGNDGTPSLNRIAGAARAELVFGAAELGLGGVFERHLSPKFGADLSMGVGDFDLYGEVAVRDGGEIDRVRYDPNAVLPVFDTPPSWETPNATALRELARVVDAYYPIYRSDGIKAQAVGGLTYSQKYNDNDTFTLGAEYFYNGLGHHGPAPYPGLVLPHSRPLVDAATFFYLGQQYGAVFLSLPAPYSLDNHAFTLSTLGNFSDLSFITRLDYGLTLLTHLRFEAFVSARYGNENGEFRFGVSRLDIGGYVFSRPPAIADFGLGLRVDI
jgi:hypothetical protein